MTERSRVALVTGANKGLGKQVARQLAELGITVLLGSRDLRRGERAAAELRGEAVPSSSGTAHRPVGTDRI